MAKPQIPGDAKVPGKLNQMSSKLFQYWKEFQTKIFIKLVWANNPLRWIRDRARLCKGMSNKQEGCGVSRVLNFDKQTKLHDPNECPTATVMSAQSL